MRLIGPLLAHLRKAFQAHRRRQVPHLLVCFVCVCFVYALGAHVYHISTEHWRPSITPSLRLQRSPTVIFTPTSGLGNSMVGLASTFALARTLGYTFFIDWSENSTKSCQVAYRDVFKDEEKYSPANIEACSDTCQLDLTQGGALGCWRAVLCNDVSQMRKLFESCTCIRVRSNQFFLSSLQSNDVLSFATVVDSIMQPSREIKSLVTNTMKGWRVKYDIDHIMGVHVRAAFDNSGVSEGNFIPRAETFKKLFWPCIRGALDEVSHIKVGIFVAADTQQVREDAEALFRSDSRIVYLPSPIKEFPNDLGLGPTRGKRVVMDAAVELFLLKESDTLFVKRDQMFASTFSAVAVSMADCEANTACYFVGKRCERVTRAVEPDRHVLPFFDCDNSSWTCNLSESQ